MNRRIIAAVRNQQELEKAVTSNAWMIFMLAPNIDDIKRQAELAHGGGKKFFIHLDLAEGIGKDEYGIRFAKAQGVDGIISTRTNIIKMAKKENLCTVQRFFILDSHSVHTTIESAKMSTADMIEMMPGPLSKIITKLSKELETPVVAGGLIETVEEAENAILSGATAVSTGKGELWECV